MVNLHLRAVVSIVRIAHTTTTHHSQSQPAHYVCENHYSYMPKPASQPCSQTTNRKRKRDCDRDGAVCKVRCAMCMNKIRTTTCSDQSVSEDTANHGTTVL